VSHDSLPRTIQVVEDGIEQGLHVGAQIHVSLDGKPLADVACGQSRPGTPMTTDTMMIWFSSTKAVTSTAAAIVWERGGFGLDDPVHHHIPEFATNGKEAVTIRHLFTHTAGFRFAERAAGGVFAPWDALLQAVIESPLEEGWVPGARAGYHAGSTMIVLGEIVRRIDGRPLSQFVRDEIFLPLGMDDCWIGMPPETHAGYGDRIGVMHNAEGEKPVPLPAVDGAEAAERCVPGAGGRGPMRQLARLYEMFRNDGELDGVRVLKPQTVAAMTARHRVGMTDETFGVPIDWGLGLIIDGFLFGPHSSPRTYGHGGARSSVAFCDPEHGLVVALVLNGMPKPQDHYRRQSAITSAIYRDAGLAGDSDAGREVPVPTIGLL
jgi:CubicO group peptidase (beta-lactamase class C family)